MKPHYCRKSPTKAHHWMFPPVGGPHDCRKAKCKYCGEEREFTARHPYDYYGKGDIHAKVLLSHGMRIIDKEEVT